MNTTNYITDNNLPEELKQQITIDLLSDTISDSVTVALIKEYTETYPNHTAKWTDYNPQTGRAGYYLPRQYEISLSVRKDDWNHPRRITYTEYIEGEAHDHKAEYTNYEELNQALNNINFRRQLLQDYNDNKTLKAQDDNGEIDQDTVIEQALEEYITNYYAQVDTFRAENERYPEVRYIGIQDTYCCDFNTEYRITYDREYKTLAYTDSLIDYEIEHTINYHTDIQDFINTITPLLNDVQDAQLDEHIANNPEDYADEDEELVAA